MSNWKAKLTKFCDIGQLEPLVLVDNLAVVSLAGNIDAEDDCLVNHLVEMHRRADILRHLGLGINEEVAGNVHELDEDSEVLLDGRMVVDDAGRTLLRRDALFWVVETRQRSHRSSREAWDGSGKNSS